MRYELPVEVRQTLAARETRLHHLLWHAIRNSWHAFTDEQKALLGAEHQGWVPNIARFVRAPTPDNPNGVQVNLDAGESFLYMHRRMIAAINAQLGGLGEPHLEAWLSLPAPDDADYPVPGRGSSEVKNDAMGEVMRERMAAMRNPVILSANSLSTIGAFVESFIHDLMHGRWAEAPGVMADFPAFNPLTVDIVVQDRFNDLAVDWLGHPYSSHVNSTFWKLHGWVDDTIDHWVRANGLDEVVWTDTWSGDYPEPGPAAPTGGTEVPAMHGHGHQHHSAEELGRVLRTINSFEGCQVGFDYVLRHNIQAPELAGE